MSSHKLKGHLFEVQSQKAVIAHFFSKQLQPFSFAEDIFVESMTMACDCDSVRYYSHTQHLLQCTVHHFTNDVCSRVKRFPVSQQCCKLSNHCTCYNGRFITCSLSIKLSYRPTHKLHV